jgi:hypothetical protein
MRTLRRYRYYSPTGAEERGGNAGREERGRGSGSDGGKWDGEGRGGRREGLCWELGYCSHPCRRIHAAALPDDVSRWIRSRSHGLSASE